jgi:hypothetical protein
MTVQAPPELVLDRYRVGSRLATGAAGTVVGAVDTETGRAVVVKFFDGSDDNFAAWIGELRLAMRLRHPSIPACLSAGHDPAWGLSVLVFERALGGSLRRALAGGRRFTADACGRVLADVAAALAYAHGHGVIHRDVKPENILARTTAGEPPWLLTDFGAGRFLPRGALARAPAGTLLYMAPEVLKIGGDAASDQYSLGVVGVELRTGSVPDPRARSQFRLRHCDGDDLDRVIARLLEPDPGRRFPGVEVAAAALAEPVGCDVTVTRDGCHYALVGADVRVVRPGRATLEHVARLPGARGFLNAWGDGAAVVAVDDRLVALTPFPRAIGAAPPGRMFVVDGERASAWCLDDGGLCGHDLGGGGVRVALEVPRAWHGARLLGILVDPGHAVLGARGCDELAWVERDEAGARARLVRAPGPLHDLRRVGGRAVVLCGDEARAIVSLATSRGLAELAAVDAPVDTLRVEPAPAGELVVTRLGSTPVCVGEDGS